MKLKKLLLLIIISLIGSALVPRGVIFAQGMMGFSSSSPDSAAGQSQQQEEQEGKKLLADLGNKTITCSQLKDADFEKIGEYFMGQSVGDTSRHIAMNEMMKGMTGEPGEEQMHIAMGKRLSGCDPSATFPSGGMGFMPSGGFGWVMMILWWVLIIVGIVALIKWLTGQSRKEFEDKKKDLT